MSRLYQPTYERSRQGAFVGPLVLAAVCAALLGLLPATARAVVPTQEEPVAVLRALDKMTARVEVLEVPVDKPVSFGSIIIEARTCRVTLPEETPEAAAFLDISELKPGEKDAPIFSGWMFASSPALSAMEHPVYDIWLVGCKEAPAAK
jgi:hypothetical protein